MTRSVWTAESDWLDAAIIYALQRQPRCGSPRTRLSAAVEKVRPQAPLLGPYTLGLVGVCSSWPAPENALGAVKATGAAPILVLGAVDDPVAPYASVQSLAGQLGSATADQLAVRSARQLPGQLLRHHGRRRLPAAGRAAGRRQPVPAVIADGEPIGQCSARAADAGTGAAW